MMSGKEIVLLCCHHHSDLVWRRTKEEYEKVREEHILHNLKLFRKYPEFRFCFAQAEILKKFISSHPELEDEVKELIKQNKIELVGRIVSIPDTNLISGESLIRNISLGTVYYEKEFDKRPTIAWFMDAFGMNGQLPQILKKAGFIFLLPGRMPGLPEPDWGKGFLWEGIDGTSIITGGGTACVQTLEYACNLPLIFTKEERMDYSLKEMQKLPGLIFAFYCTEEGFLEEVVFEKIREVNEQGKKIVLAQPSDYYTGLEGKDLPRFKGEFNPEFSGCYTSRIEIKMMNRQSEVSLINAEKICSLTHLLLGDFYPQEVFNSLWERLCLCQFHDGICGCHSDGVYNDIKKEYKDITEKAKEIISAFLNILASNVSGEKILLFNGLDWERKELICLEGVSDIQVKDNQGNALPIQVEGGNSYFLAMLPSFGYTTFSFQKGNHGKREVITNPSLLENFSFENDNYYVSLKGSEIKIRPKFMEEDIFPERGFGEILFREDTGDLWKEEYGGFIRGKEVEDEQVEKIVSGKVFTKILIKGAVLLKQSPSDFELFWDGFGKLSWQKEYIFVQNLRRFYLRLKMGWEGRNTKIFVSFPLLIDPEKSKSLYEIPFGFIERNPYFEVPWKYRNTFKEFPPSVLQNAKGDWPALNWVDYCDDKRGVSMANRGTPGHQLKAGKIYVSLLRSPTRRSSGFNPGVTSWDNGTHIYEFAFLPHTSDSLEEAMKLGTEFNHSPLLVFTPKGKDSFPPQKTFISVSEPGIVLSAFKKSEKGEGFILRFFESLGKECEVEIKLGFETKEIKEINLLEEEEKSVTGNIFHFLPFEIKTLKIGGIKSCHGK